MSRMCNTESERRKKLTKRGAKSQANFGFVESKLGGMEGERHTSFN